MFKANLEKMTEGTTDVAGKSFWLSDKPEHVYELQVQSGRSVCQTWHLHMTQLSPLDAHVSRLNDRVYIDLRG